MYWRMLYDRRPLLTTFADKVAVRDYVAKAVGAEVLPRVHAIVDDPADLTRAQLPVEFVIKPSHSSNRIWIVADPVRLGCPDPSGVTERQSRITPNDDTLDWEKVVSTCRGWLAHNYSDLNLEWAYKDVIPKIIVEELLVDPEGGLPTDYKFLVFRGKAWQVHVTTGRFVDQRCNAFSPDWVPSDWVTVKPGADRTPARPRSLERMIQIAETLGREMDFVRVDLYCIGERVYFGELTNYPWAGNHRFQPESFNEELGAHWILD
jgi:hypothetical protein